MAKKTAKAKKAAKTGADKAARSKPKSKKSSGAWQPYAIGGAVLVILGVNALLGWSDSPWAWRVASLLGVCFLLGIALLLSENRRAIPGRTILTGLGLQIGLGILVLWTGSFGKTIFNAVGFLFTKVREWSLMGALMPFRGGMPDAPPFKGVVFAIELVAIIVFIGALSRMLYHLGLMQWVVRGMAWLMRRVMRTSGAESVASAANVFVGMVESPLTVRPYVAGMTRSELFTMMSAGMATIAGSVMVIYSGILEEAGVIADPAGHLLTASLMSAPAAILIAKILIPETGEPATLDAGVVPALDDGDGKPVNVMDAAARGGLEGMKLAINVIGMLIAFVALVWMANGILGAVTGGYVTFDKLAGWLFSPIAVGMGVPLADSVEAGGLMGTKTVLNEFLAYEGLAKVGGDMTSHTRRVMSYALCGFANFGSVAIMIAGIGGIAPKRRGDLARLGLLSIVSGTLAAFMTGCWAGLLGDLFKSGG